MSKLDQYMQGRTEGMEFALRLAKDKGIEELEKEVRFRNRTGVSLNLTRQEIAAGSDKIKNMTFDTMLAMSLMTLRDEFTFGKKRLERFKDRFTEKSCISGRRLLHLVRYSRRTQGRNGDRFRNPVERQEMTDSVTKKGCY